MKIDKRKTNPCRQPEKKQKPPSSHDMPRRSRDGDEATRKGNEKRGGKRGEEKKAEGCRIPKWERRGLVKKMTQFKYERK